MSNSRRQLAQRLPIRADESGGTDVVMILTILVILLLLALFSGGYGSSRGWGYFGWSPLGLLILIVLILALTGTLSL